MGVQLPQITTEPDGGVQLPPVPTADPPWTVVETIDLKALSTQVLDASDGVKTLSSGQDVRTYGTGYADIDLTNGVGVEIVSTSGGHAAFGIDLADLAAYDAAKDNVIQWIVKIENLPQIGTTISNCGSCYFSINNAAASPFTAPYLLDGFIGPFSTQTGSYNLRTATNTISATDKGIVTTTVPYTGHVLFTAEMSCGSMRSYVQTISSDEFIAPDEIDATRFFQANLPYAESENWSAGAATIAWVDQYDPGTVVDFTITQFRLLTRA
jgi:hypothetical protein